MYCELAWLYLLGASSLLIKSGSGIVDTSLYFLGPLPLYDGLANCGEQRRIKFRGHSFLPACLVLGKPALRNYFNSLSLDDSRHIASFLYYFYAFSIRKSNYFINIFNAISSFLPSRGICHDD